MSGISLKSVHTWCSRPKQKIHKSSQIANARKQEFKGFLLQDSISFEHPGKKYAGKRFLRDTLEVTRQKYLQQPEFHKHGIISLLSMKEYRPGYIMLCNKTPLDQCLCDECENFEQLLKALKAVGMKSVPSNRYAAVDCVVCEDRCQQVGTNFTFPKQECIEGNCQNCGTAVLEGILCKENIDMVTQNRLITWRKWVTWTGKSAPEKCQIKGTIQQAISELVQMLQSLEGHLFRANLNCNMFDYIRKHVQNGQVVQIFDFAMNVRNLYQDKVQSAYWDSMQTSIHAVINFFCVQIKAAQTL